MGKKKERRKWIVTTFIWWEVIFLSLQHFTANALDLMPYYQARGTRDFNKGILIENNV